MKLQTNIFLLLILTSNTFSFCQSSVNRCISLSDTNFKVGDYYYLPKYPSPFGPCWPSNNDTTNSFLLPLAIFLKQNPEIKRVEFCMHTDGRPIPITNDTFSLLVAQTIKEYIVKQGVDHNRIIVKGCGDHYPIQTEKDTVVTFPNNTKFTDCINTSLFIKKNTIVDDEFIKRLNNKCEQELAYYFNRRTVMTILKIE